MVVDLGRHDPATRSAGKVDEWETSEYVQHAVTVERPHGLVVVGHCAGEEPGVRSLARHIRQRLPEAPVTLMGVGDPFTVAR